MHSRVRRLREAEQMALGGQDKPSTHDLLQGQLKLWHHSLGYIKSMALKSALDLRIPDAIHGSGGTATLSEILTKTALHPSKRPCLRRLMRVLTVSGIFSIHQSAAPTDGGEAVYGLTTASRLLVSGESPTCLSPGMSMLVSTAFVTPFLRLGSWFQNERPMISPFEMAHGQTFWEMAEKDAAFNELVNNGMVSDSRFCIDIVLKEGGQIFQGISSLVDVAGGHGGVAIPIAKAFPHVKCTVLDLPYVVAGAPTNTDVRFVAGDMFESIPPADAVFLKCILHDWGDDECVKILQRCKEAIPRKEDGGKVIIIDTVIGSGPPSDTILEETHALYDLYMMFINGVERDEKDWKMIFFKAGFKDYKIIPVLGVESVIELYP